MLQAWSFCLVKAFKKHLLHGFTSSAIYSSAPPDHCKSESTMHLRSESSSTETAPHVSAASQRYEQTAKFIYRRAASVDAKVPSKSMAAPARRGHVFGSIIPHCTIASTPSCLQMFGCLKLRWRKGFCTDWPRRPYILGPLLSAHCRSIALVVRGWNLQERWEGLQERSVQSCA